MINNVHDYDGNPAGEIALRRREVLVHLDKNRFSRVLDVGGAFGPWSAEFTTHYLDINDVKIEGKIVFLGDINDESGWAQVQEDVLKNGKFDYVICTHTLEDIRNPITVLKLLPQIGKAGFISVPNKHTELSLVENCARADMNNVDLKRPYNGYCHHRWIFSMQEPESEEFVFYLFPKLQFVFCIDHYEWVDPLKVGGELSFWWEDTLEFQAINDDFLGPNPMALFDMYRAELMKGR